MSSSLQLSAFSAGLQLLSCEKHCCDDKHCMKTPVWWKRTIRWYLDLVLPGILSFLSCNIMINVLATPIANTVVFWWSSCDIEVVCCQGQSSSTIQWTAWWMCSKHQSKLESHHWYILNTCFVRNKSLPSITCENGKKMPQLGIWCWYTYRIDRGLRNTH